MKLLVCKLPHLLWESGTESHTSKRCWQEDFCLACAGLAEVHHVCVEGFGSVYVWGVWRPHGRLGTCVYINQGWDSPERWESELMQDC